METLLEKDFSHFLTGSYAFGHEELLIGDLMKENLKELWDNRHKRRMFRGGFSLENL